MKQHEAVIQAMQQNGGYATLGQLYQLVPQVPDCVWNTKTPFASIRRIVQTHPAFFKIRPGLWALSAEKQHVLQLFAEPTSLGVEKDHAHYFYQGLIVEIGNFKGFQTFVPAQDKNQPFAQKRLYEVATLAQLDEFTYESVLRCARTIDVTWMNSRRYPHAFFEVEHTTNGERSLIKFLELQDFRANFYLVTSAEKQGKLRDTLVSVAFAPIQKWVKVLSYEAVTELHEKISRSARAEQALL